MAEFNERGEPIEEAEVRPTEPQARPVTPERVQAPVEEPTAPQQQIFVRVAELGSMPINQPVLEGATVAEALAMAGVQAGLEVRLNGRTADQRDIVRDGDTIIAMPKIRGGL